ncbi:TetR/AcrR family transcriptional regulator [Streptomyces griseocarneus]|uniref:TetR/AcrR family transcriptional regulator n=1 Tax=Streptomyces griseocarneus TaxID=51201 RepID=UPI00167EA581|nr:TetR/AcrR family transcriptional regulator [Streptomyces griseocarneus]MBZ6473651.1 TetR/AcrR family transcriptional regulator [Streptomyces griseocarneus]GHG55816.1 TetR family transcriptional regulator [Streptomyces griseocarneus]
MGDEPGLRERKKQRTRQALSDTAIELFLKRGFDQVSVADVAAAVEVSKPTLFRYFPTKEDLALDRIADHQGEAARVVSGRTAGQSPLGALRAHFHERLEAHDPVTGLNDNAIVRAFNDMLYTTPSLLARLVRYSHRDEELLAGALEETGGSGGLTARLAAAQIITVHQRLAEENWRKLASGRTVADALPEAHADADRAYDLLGAGLMEQYA